MLARLNPIAAALDLPAAVMDGRTHSVVIDGQSFEYTAAIHSGCYEELIRRPAGGMPYPALAVMPYEVTRGEEFVFSRLGHYLRQGLSDWQARTLAHRVVDGGLVQVL